MMYIPECSVGKARCGWSGGRAARASAARALLHARLASALLLDEPGAALDAPAERALLAAVAAAAPDTTIITVAVTAYISSSGGLNSNRASTPQLFFCRPTFFIRLPKKKGRLCF